MTKTEVCELCGGSGRAWDFIHALGESILDICPDCQGRGKFLVVGGESYTREQIERGEGLYTQEGTAIYQRPDEVIEMNLEEFTDLANFLAENEGGDE